MLHLLVFRFSAMGDVALTVPVLRSVLDQNPEIKITLVTRPKFLPFFYGIERLEIISTDFKDGYKGFWGLIRLFRFLKKRGKYHSIVDLHGVLRTWMLDFLFRLTGTPVKRIKKGRKEKRAFINGAKNQKLPHATERYFETFCKVISGCNPEFTVGILRDKNHLAPVQSWLKGKKIPGNTTLIGVAPMAKHPLKMWPTENFVKLTELISRDHRVFYLFFGGGEVEKSRIDRLVKEIPDSLNLAGEFSLEQEMALISRLKFMISMDSANMHIAALLGVPTLSIWGGTHPALGFSALNQPPEHNIQISMEELSCRPCTVFGKGECHRGDFACMNRITPEMVSQQIKYLKLL